MKIFRIGSSTVVTECQVFLNFLPITYQIDLRIAKFSQQVAASENCICQCFSSSALQRLNEVHLIYGNYAISISSLRRAMESTFFK